MDPQFIETLRAKMKKALSVLVEDLQTIRTGRATPALVENVIIGAYDNSQHLKLKELATITTEGARMLIAAPFDPSIIKDIEKGLNSANLGFTASINGNVIRINIPSLTSERREEYIKLAHGKVEGGRIMVRQIRHEAMITLKNKFESKEISEDEKKSLEKKIQEITDEMISEIEVLKEKKEKELREL